MLKELHKLGTMPNTWNTHNNAHPSKGKNTYGNGHTTQALNTSKAPDYNHKAPQPMVNFGPTTS